MAYLFAQADAGRLPLADESVDLVCGSPPYAAQRTYDDGSIPEGRTIAMDPEDWVRWMLGVTAEALRVSRGAVVWVVGCPTADRSYQPIAEALMVEWWRAGGSMYRPVYWRRVGIMGSGGDQWFRADVEYCMAFKRPGPLPWTDNTAMGKPPKYGPGGAPSHRITPGKILTTTSGYTANGDARVIRKVYTPPKLTNPGNWLNTGSAGGGHLGHRLAHENEAPFDERVPEFFIRSLCPPGGTVLDPFSGSGTTVSVAKQHDRNGIGFDLRMSQCKLGRRRVGSTLAPTTYRDETKDDGAPLFAA